MRFATSHPALPGHFPGHPVVPGVLLLEAVVNALPAQVGVAVRVTGFPAVKFLAPLQPERDVEIAIAIKRAGQASFELVAGNEKIANGTVTYQPVDGGTP
jgi:3-hydroxymyristoyl/3-hydroxydecanoyl-(acyl carrier protein) dehydratase